MLRQLIWEDANEEEQDELRDDMPDVIQWIDTSKMLVDALTKDMNSSELRHTLKTGVWNTVPSPEAQLIKLMKQKYRRERRIREAEELAVPQDRNHG